MMNDYKIKNILESLKEEVENGKVSLREAAVELHKAGWTNFIDIDATRNLLKTRNVTGNGNVPGVSDMMGKYREMKAAHPDALYIFRNGESCELYEDDAIAASGILGIATAERVDGQGKGVKELRFSFRDADGWSDYHIIRHRSEEADTSREENLWLRLGISVRGSREDIERILNGDTETLRKLLDAGRYGIGGETYVPGSTVEGYNEDHDTEFEEEDVEFHL